MRKGGRPCARSVFCCGSIPHRFAAKDGDEMAADFAARWHQASGLAVAGLWIERSPMRSPPGRAHMGTFFARIFVRRSDRFAARGLRVDCGARRRSRHRRDDRRIRDRRSRPLRPLPFPDADRLVNLWQDQSYRGYPRLAFSPENYLDWRRMLTTLDSGGAWRGLSVNLVGEGTPEHLDAAVVTGECFRRSVCSRRSGVSFRRPTTRAEPHEPCCSARVSGARASAGTPACSAASFDSTTRRTPSSGSCPRTSPIPVARPCSGFRCSSSRQTSAIARTFLSMRSDG